MGIGGATDAIYTSRGDRAPPGVCLRDGWLCIVAAERRAVPLRAALPPATAAHGQLGQV